MVFISVNGHVIIDDFIQPVCQGLSPSATRCFETDCAEQFTTLLGFMLQI